MKNGEIDMDLETQLREMPAADAEAFRAVAAKLRAWPEARVRDGFAARVLAAIGDDAPRSRAPRRARPVFELRPWRGLAAAACAALLLGGSLLAIRRMLPQTPRSDADAEWLAAAQEPDGSWDPARHGGSAAYRPALTALSALALAESGSEYSASVGAACAALAACQRPNGAFGGTGRAECYNHAIAAFALASLAPRSPDARRTLERAVDFIRASQTASGGWDYIDGSEGNAALTAWNLRALDVAAGHGIASANAPRRKGLRWMREAVRGSRALYHLDSTESSSTESLNALAAYTFLASAHSFPELEPVGRLIAKSVTVAPRQDAGADCYRDYSKFIAFEAAGETAKASAISRRLSANRSAAVREDAWGMVGGSVYSRALTLLAQPFAERRLARN